MLIARDNLTHFLSALRLITVPAAKTGLAEAGAIQPGPAHDAALREVAAGHAGLPEGASAKLDWLHEFELTSGGKRDSSPREPFGEGLDTRLLAE